MRDAATIPCSRGEFGPPSRLLGPIAAHAAALDASSGRIAPAHQAAGEELAGWIVGQLVSGTPLHVIVVCTGNSRRSVLGSVLGNIAAAYHGLPMVRFHSGGTEPSAVNHRTIAALRAIGVEVVPTGELAPSGPGGEPNPVYRIRWGEPGLATTEFSKTYDDPANPRSGFAALMICGEADAGCPTVRGASIRIPMPYEDPQSFDGTPEESTRYAERRDDIGRLMLSTMRQVRERLDDVSSTG